MPIINAKELREVSPEEHDQEVTNYLNQCRDELNEFLNIHAETLTNGGAAMYVPSERKGDLWRIVQKSLKAELEAAGYNAYLAPRTSVLLDDNDIRIELSTRRRAENRVPRLTGAEVERHDRLAAGEDVTEPGPTVVQVEVVDGEAKSANVVAPEAKSDHQFVSNPLTDGDQAPASDYSDPAVGVDVNGESNGLSEAEATTSRRGRSRS